MKKYADMHKIAIDIKPDVSYLIDALSEAVVERIDKSIDYYANSCISDAIEKGYTDFKLVFSDLAFTKLIRISPELLRIKKIPLIGYRLYYKNVRCHIKYYGDDRSVMWIV